MYARLAAQQHRRFIKTHTPLDGIPLDPRATYIVVARHPLDMAVSLYHQSDNIDRARLRQLTGQPEPGRAATAAASRCTTGCSGGSPATTIPASDLDSLPGVMWHLSDAWARRDEPNVVLVHYDDLSADLDGQMRRLAGRLGISRPGAGLARARAGGHVRAHAGQRGQARSRRPGSSRATPRSSAAAPRAPGARFSATPRSPPTTPARPGWQPPDMLAWLHSPRQNL